jgi:hypothetical protein
VRERDPAVNLVDGAQIGLAGELLREGERGRAATKQASQALQPSSSHCA